MATSASTFRGYQVRGPKPKSKPEMDEPEITHSITEPKETRKILARRPINDNIPPPPPDAPPPPDLPPPPDAAPAKKKAVAFSPPTISSTSSSLSSSSTSSTPSFHSTKSYQSSLSASPSPSHYHSVSPSPSSPSPSIPFDPWNIYRPSAEDNIHAQYSRTKPPEFHPEQQVRRSALEAIKEKQTRVADISALSHETEGAVTALRTTKPKRDTSPPSKRDMSSPVSTLTSLMRKPKSSPTSSPKSSPTSSPSSTHRDSPTSSNHSSPKSGKRELHSPTSEKRDIHSSPTSEKRDILSSPKSGKREIQSSPTSGKRDIQPSPTSGKRDIQSSPKYGIRPSPKEDLPPAPESDSPPPPPAPLTPSLSSIPPPPSSLAASFIPSHFPSPPEDDDFTLPKPIATPSSIPNFFTPPSHAYTLKSTAPTVPPKVNVKSTPTSVTLPKSTSSKPLNKSPPVSPTHGKTPSISTTSSSSTASSKSPPSSPSSKPHKVSSRQSLREAAATFTTEQHIDLTNPHGHIGLPISIYDWNTSHVMLWWSSMGGICALYQVSAKEANLDGRSLLALTDTTLQQKLKIGMVAHRKHILGHLDDLRKRQELIMKQRSVKGMPSSTISPSTSPHITSLLSSNVVSEFSLAPSTYENSVTRNDEDEDGREREISKVDKDSTTLQAEHTQLYRAWCSQVDAAHYTRDVLPILIEQWSRRHVTWWMRTLKGIGDLPMMMALLNIAGDDLKRLTERKIVDNEAQFPYMNITFAERDQLLQQIANLVKEQDTWLAQRQSRQTAELKAQRAQMIANWDPIDYHELRMISLNEEKIPERGHTQWYDGEWTSQNIPVMIKLYIDPSIHIDEELSREHVTDLQNEALMMRTCQHSPYIQYCYGFAAEKPALLVCEAVTGGTLAAELQHVHETTSIFHPQHPKNQSTHQGGWAQLVRVAWEIGMGLLHMHDRGIIHRQLTAHHILLDSTHHVRIANFSRACTIHSVGQASFKSKHQQLMSQYKLDSTDGLRINHHKKASTRIMSSHHLRMMSGPIEPTITKRISKPYISASLALDRIVEERKDTMDIEKEQQLKLARKTYEANRYPVQWLNSAALAGNFSFATDLYSYGCVLFEIATSTSPFQDEYDDIDINDMKQRYSLDVAIIKRKMKGGDEAEPVIPESVPSRYAELIRACWYGKLTLTEIVHQLAIYADELIIAEVPLPPSPETSPPSGKRGSHIVSQNGAVPSLNAKPITEDQMDCYHLLCARMLVACQRSDVKPMLMMGLHEENIQYAQRQVEDDTRQRRLAVVQTNTSSLPSSSQVLSALSVARLYRNHALLIKTIQSYHDFDVISKCYRLICALHMDPHATASVYWRSLCDPILESMKLTPDSGKLQRQGCQALSILLAHHIHTDDGYTTYLAREMISVVTQAMRKHVGDPRMQERACQVIIHLAHVTPHSRHSLIDAGAIDLIKLAMKTHASYTPLIRAAIHALGAFTAAQLQSRGVFLPILDVLSTYIGTSKRVDDTTQLVNKPLKKGMHVHMGNVDIIEACCSTLHSIVSHESTPQYIRLFIRGLDKSSIRLLYTAINSFPHNIMIPTGACGFLSCISSPDVDVDGEITTWIDTCHGIDIMMAAVSMMDHSTPEYASLHAHICSIFGHLAIDMINRERILKIGVTACILKSLSTFPTHVGVVTNAITALARLLHHQPAITPQDAVTLAKRHHFLQKYSVISTLFDHLRTHIRCVDVVRAVAWCLTSCCEGDVETAATIHTDSRFARLIQASVLFADHATLIAHIFRLLELMARFEPPIVRSWLTRMIGLNDTLDGLLTYASRQQASPSVACHLMKATTLHDSELNIQPTVTGSGKIKSNSIKSSDTRNLIDYIMLLIWMNADHVRVQDTGLQLIYYLITFYDEVKISGVDTHTIKTESERIAVQIYDLGGVDCALRALKNHAHDSHTVLHALLLLVHMMQEGQPECGDVATSVAIDDGIEMTLSCMDAFRDDGPLQRAGLMLLASMAYHNKFGRYNASSVRQVRDLCESAKSKFSNQKHLNIKIHAQKVLNCLPQDQSKCIIA